MTRRGFVSIVLPTYNGEQYLAEAIESCLAQTYKKFEVIIVDDASVDSTCEIARRYCAHDRRVRYIRHSCNKRLPGALNTGFAEAKGDYFTWTSDDNLYEPDALEVMVEFLEEHHDYGMVYCDVLVIDALGSITNVWKLAAPDNLRNTNCVQACFMYRRDVAATIGAYSDDMFLVEDYDYWLRIHKKFRIAHLSGVHPYRYRRHEASLTARRQCDIVVQLARAQAENLLPRRERKRFISQACWNAVWRFRARGDHTAAWKCARRSVAFRPLSVRYWKTLAGCTVRLWDCRNARVASSGAPSSVAPRG